MTNDSEMLKCRITEIGKRGVKCTNEMRVCDVTANDIQHACYMCSNGLCLSTTFCTLAFCSRQHFISIHLAPNTGPFHYSISMRLRYLETTWLVAGSEKESHFKIISRIFQILCHSVINKIRKRFGHKIDDIFAIDK